MGFRELVWSQLLSYSLPPWLLFVAIAFCAARFGKRGYWIILGQILVALVVMSLDVCWIEKASAAKRDLSGVPDMDMLFSFGCLFRAILINTAQLPVTALGVWLRSRKETREGAARN